VAAVLLGSVGAQAASAGIVVDNDKAQCPKAGYRTISRALAAAPAGATVVVCPGTYVEHVRMTKPGVRLVGLTRHARDVVLRPPKPHMLIPEVVEMAAPSTTLEAITVSGPGFDLFNGGITAVRVTNGPGPFAEAAVIQNVVVRTRARTSNGLGEITSGVVIGQRRRPARAIVLASRILNVNNGISVFRGSQATLRDNVIMGPASSNEEPSFGIEVFRASVEVLGNDVSGYDSSVGIGIDFSGRGTLGGSVPGTGNNIHHNATGVFMGGHHALVSNNRVHDNLATGIFVFGGSLQISASSLNQFVGNVITNNHTLTAGFDCEDQSIGTGTAGTANTWTDNIGGTSSPRAICPPPPAGP
jgi:hypothetical protein